VVLTPCADPVGCGAVEAIGGESEDDVTGSCTVELLAYGDIVAFVELLCAVRAVNRRASRRKLS